MESTSTRQVTQPTGGACLRRELKVTGDQLPATVRKLVHEGYCRRIIIRDEEGLTLIELPLGLGLVGALLAPVWAAIGAMAAIATGFSLVVESHDEGESHA